MSALALEPEPISPELVLVASPEEALRARALLPPPLSTFDRLAECRRREAVEPPPPAVERRRRRALRRPLLAAAALVLVAAVALAWVERPRPLRPYFSTRTAPVRRAAATPVRPAQPLTTATPVPVPVTPVLPPAQPAVPPHRVTKAATKPAARRPRAVRHTVTHTVAAAPAAGEFVPARVWVWSPDAHAKGYVFELTMNGGVVLHVRTTQPRFELPRSFAFRPGAYRWTVHGLPAGSGVPLADSRFTLTAHAAALANG